MTRLRFEFKEAKALAALSLIARSHPGLTPLYVAKIIYFAERLHINRYGRPIAGDDFIAMPAGPVPSAIKNFIDEKWNWVQRPERIELAIMIDHSSRYAKLMPGVPDFDLSDLSDTDRECIIEAVAYCVSKNPDDLSWETHQHDAWRLASRNRSMDYVLFIDQENPNKDAIKALLEEEAMASS